ncbi:MAG: HAD-IIIA family hydrolase [Candidatus Electryonea clarkiae]|nr:HAD-IIIA family hydrolase [Candidatus Electryonea clarkiae]MDP8289036.1 HAD-IIIA family hydrolase [Candidatus Electryonea clarkiae]
MALNLSDSSLQDRLAKIEMIIVDVDGVLTDGLAYYDSNGMAMKAFSMRDGFGFVLAKFAGIELGVLTGNVAEMVKRRLEAFNITRIKGGHFRKLGFYEEMVEETGIPEQEIIYIGDDLFDLPVLRRVGFSVAPADAHPDVIRQVDAVTESKGGRGVVREVIEAVVRAKGKWDEVIEMIENDEDGGR